MALQAAFIVPHPPLIVPAVGRGREEEIRTTIDAYDEVARQIAELAPQTIIVTSPHATAYQDYFHISPGTSAQGDMRRFDARDSELTCTYDAELADRIALLASAEGFPAGTDYERDPSIDHATYIPLYFVTSSIAITNWCALACPGTGPSSTIISDNSSRKPSTNLAAAPSSSRAATSRTSSPLMVPMGSHPRGLPSTRRLPRQWHKAIS